MCLSSFLWLKNFQVSVFRVFDFIFLQFFKWWNPTKLFHCDSGQSHGASWRLKSVSWLSLNTLSSDLVVWSHWWSSFRVLTITFSFKRTNLNQTWKQNHREGPDAVWGNEVKSEHKFNQFRHADQFLWQLSNYHIFWTISSLEYERLQSKNASERRTEHL